MRLRTPGPVALVASGGLSYLPDITLTGSVPIGIEVSGVPALPDFNPRLTLRAAPGESEDRWGVNGGAGLRFGGRVAVIGEVRVFYFRDYELRFGAENSGEILDDLLAGLAPVDFDPVFVNVQAGVTFRFLKRTRFKVMPRAQSASPVLVIGVTGLGNATTRSAMGQGSRSSLAVVGDTGEVTRGLLRVAREMGVSRARPGEVRLRADAGRQHLQRGVGRGFAKVFEEPFADLLASGVRFFAALGNHDIRRGTELQIHYPAWNMKGRRFYEFSKGDGLIEFFGLVRRRCPTRPGRSCWWKRHDSTTSAPRSSARKH